MTALKPVPCHTTDNPGVATLATLSLDPRSFARSTIGFTSDLCRLVPVVIAFVQPALRTVEDARVRDARGVAEVDVDARHHLGTLDPDVGEGGVALAHRVAVPARAVHLADVAGEKVLDGDRAAAVVLQHLVIRAAGATAVDV